MMSSTIKQVKISTSILWLLNKAETRNVFFSSTDIFDNKAKLHLHSLIIRGLISGELYCAVLTKLFPSNGKSIRTKDFQSILDFIIGLDLCQLAEVLVLRQKNRSVFIGNLTKSEPFELSEHLQVIDAIMSIYLALSESISSIPIIVGKLCNYRPNIKDQKKLLEIWFKCMTCLSLIDHNIKDVQDLMKSIAIQENDEGDEKEFLDAIKFSDKVALIMDYESDALELDQEFIFDYSSDGATNRDNVKHNFIAVIHVFRKNFPKVLEDFKELMLVLNSSHIQISINLLINIDIFILEFFTNLEERTNHGNRTFRAGSQNSDTKEISSSRTFRIENAGKEVKGVYHSVNKPTQNSTKHAAYSTFGSYTGRKQSSIDYQSSAYEEQSINWTTQKAGSNLLYSNRKSSVPNGLNLAGINKTVSSSSVIADGTLKTNFLGRKDSAEKIEVNNDEKTDSNQTSWLLQSAKNEKSNKPSIKNGLNDQKTDGPRLKVNETRLRLNLKRQEIEGNRRQMQHQLAKERQLLSDRVFKDVAMGISQTEEEEMSSYRPRKVSDMKRGRNPQIKPDLIRSRSQDLSKSSVDDISESLNQLKSEISKLTTEQARLSAKIAESKIESAETFSPRFNRNSTTRENRYDGRTTDGESIKSMPMSWHPYSNYGNEDVYNNFNKNYASHYQYSMENPQMKFYPVPFTQYSSYPYGYPSDPSSFQVPPPINSITPYHLSKSLRDDTSSRPCSPGAMSEPSKLADMLSQKSIQVTEPEPLTIQNLIKHNKSMEHLPNDAAHIENKSDKSSAKNPEDKRIPEFISGPFPDSFRSSTQNSTNAIKPIADSNNVNGTPVISPSKQNINSKESPQETVEVQNANNLNSDNTNMFFVSFGDDKQNTKKPQKVPKAKEEKDSNNNHKSNLSFKSDNKNILISPTENSTKKADKPLAFVINVNEEDKDSSNDSAIISDKLQQLTEKREQERKKNLEKAKEATKIINEARLLKELEKEKLKEERKQKREAIFEAYLEKKLSNESNEPPNKKDVKIIKKPSRAISATPSLQRHEVQNYDFYDPGLPIDNNYPVLINQSARPDKVMMNFPGPKLFVEPKIKSNKNVILNAIKYCCLAGKVNEPLQQQTIEELDRFIATHFMILMRGGCQYRSLYRFEFESECLTKLSGVGPKKITNKMVEKFFKYNSGSKKFIEITSTSHLSTVIDGITIFNTLWKSSTSVGNQLISSETSSQAEHPSQ